MWNRWVFLCLMVLLLSVVSCSYASSNETDILKDDVNTEGINVSSIEYDVDVLNDSGSNGDVVSIDYGERIDVDWESDVDCNFSCSVFIDNKFVGFLHFHRQTLNMYYYDFNYCNEDFNSSIYPNVGLHNISFIFEFDTPQCFDVCVDNYDDGFYRGYYSDNVFFFNFRVNDTFQPKSRYSYNSSLNILKKDKTVYINNLSFATYSNPLVYDITIPNESCFLFISNETGIILFSYASNGKNMVVFDNLKNVIKPGVYKFTIVSEDDNTFDSASFTFYNDVISNISYKIEGNDVIVNVKLLCEYNTPIIFTLLKIINETPYLYKDITKVVSIKNSNHKFNFEVRFEDVENNEYTLDVWDYNHRIDSFSLLVNFTSVNETGSIEDDVNQGINDTVNESNVVMRNISKTNNNSNGNGTKSKHGFLNSNSTHSSGLINVFGDFREVFDDFGDLSLSDDYSVLSDDAKSYEIVEKSTSKVSNNIFSSLGVVILLIVSFMIGFVKFRREL